ncbi:anthranilate synthase component I family protein [Alkalihalobacterium elongatum]|uniref:anthranilate synthase component I family protein n=1 Tax=Alkalihalobacterium elongatum TaxID=2675466 RepID=UPI002E2C6436|nr:anthranilate synthase component I family protein [Alkalihalobacterium elongatum]
MLQDNSINNQQVLTAKIPLSESVWFHQYKQLSKEEPYHVLLESGRAGRYHIIGLNPIAILKGKGQELIIEHNGQTVTQTGDLLTNMRAWMEKQHRAYCHDGTPFQGGAIGYISYDLVRQIEKLPNDAEDDLGMEELYFLVFDDVFVYDIENEELTIIVHCTKNERENALQRIEHYKTAWIQPIDEWKWQSKKEKGGEQWSASLSEIEFAEAVERIQEYIAAGDVFQVNLSVRQAKPLLTEPLHIYEKLREVNPSPYMSYFHTPDFQLTSGSPELLVKKAGDEVSTRPIAGTRSRGKTEEEDERNAKMLIENEKERAEHIMLVDLERNDLGRVCEFGTVEVDELMVIEKYSHVMHIVSNVKGKLTKGKDAYDIIRATFPGGTITGAPKVRTMEIIEELEPVRRGIYTGSIGWIGYNGDMELNIVIRTLLSKDRMAYVQAGAGIVIDSNPQHEYKESLKKATALWRAKELSEEEVSKEKVK